ncbi:pilus assembly PilX family protein [Hydrogenobaculum acidophilum]
MKYSRGFSIVTVLGLTLIISLIGATAMYISLIDNRVTGATSKYELADKAAEFGLLQAVDSIQASGFCNNTTNSGTDGLATYTTQIQRSSNICFVRSTGQVGSSKVVKTAIIQSYYGLGLYTVRGGVSATYKGGRLSGCDRSTGCYVPAFIASGKINLNGARTYSCPVDNGSKRIFGNPAIINGVKFIDLTPLFFNVDCENSIRDNCDYGLNNALEDTFATDPNTNIKDFTIDQYNQVILTNAVENSFYTPPATTPCPLDANNNLNLANLTLSGSCYINQSGVDIYGTLPSGVQYTIYILSQNANGTILENVNGNTPSANNNYGIPNYNLTIYANTPITISDGLFNTRLITDSNITYTYNGNAPLNHGVPTTTYTNPNPNPNGYNDPYTYLKNDVIIQGYDNSNEGNNIPQIGLVGDNASQIVDLYLKNTELFTRQIIFNDSSSNYFANSLVYLYADSFQANLPPTNGTQSKNDCNNNIYQCGWTDYGEQFSENVSFGNDINNNQAPSLLVNNNSVVLGGSESFTGIYFGEDVNYIWSSGATVNGFLVRNFPPNLSLQIKFDNNTKFQFSKNAINALSNEF